MVLGSKLKKLLCGAEHSYNRVAPTDLTVGQESKSASVGTLAQKVLVVFSFGLTLAASILACLWSMRSSVGIGLISQALVAVFLIEPGEFFEFLTFGIAAFVSMMPVLSNHYDTFKDIIFGSLCMQSEVPLMRNVGFFSWAYLILIHCYFLTRPTCFGELVSTYLSVLLAAPKKDTSETQAQSGSSLESLLFLVYK